MCCSPSNVTQDKVGWLPTIVIWPAWDQAFKANCIQDMSQVTRQLVWPCSKARLRAFAASPRSCPFGTFSSTSSSAGVGVFTTRWGPSGRSMVWFLGRRSIEGSQQMIFFPGTDVGQCSAKSRIETHHSKDRTLLPFSGLQLTCRRSCSPPCRVASRHRCILDLLSR